jgi:hypothetical protein
MEANLRMGRQELLDGLGLVRRQVIQHDVDFPRPFHLAYQFREKSDKFDAGVGHADLPQLPGSDTSILREQIFAGMLSQSPTLIGRNGRSDLWASKYGWSVT